MSRDKTTRPGTPRPTLFDKCVGSLTNNEDAGDGDAGDGAYGLTSLTNNEDAGDGDAGDGAYGLTSLSE